MVLRALILFFSLQAHSAVPELQAGREALARGNPAEALQAYKDIRPGDPLWTEKLEDLIRYHLAKDEGQEAWRIIQLGRRTKAARSAWADYERLAIMKANGCPLSLDAADDERAHLLNAAVYRLMPWIFQSEGSDTAAPDSTHLATGLVPFLSDIPHTKIERGQGCRAAKMKTAALPSLPKAELNELLKYLRTNSQVDSNRLLIVIRALELATLTKNEALTNELREELPAPGDIPWREFPDPERQWLFHQVFSAKRLEDLPSDKRALAQKIALQCIEAPDASAAWLAVIDLSALPAKQRRALLSRAEKLGNFAGRSWVLYELAVALYDAGDTSESLNILRRLLVEGEEILDDPLSDACVDLASRIFSQYRLDARTQGALEAALPARMWNTLLSQAMIRAAIAGRAGEYTKLQRMRETMRNGAYASLSLEADLNRAMAFRQLGTYRKHLAGLQRASGQEAKLLAYAHELVSFLFEDEGAAKNILPYTRELSARLEALAAPGTSRADEVGDLVQLLNSTSERMAGNKSVRKGVLKVGVARWSRADLKPATFALQPPALMPRRELFFVPDLNSERGWKFSTAKR